MVFKIAKNAIPLTPAEKQEIKIRDGWQCQQCGTNQRLTIHHIVPRIEGGNNDPCNLITLCRHCHNLVHSR